MSYYILYKRGSNTVKIVTRRPSSSVWRKRGYGFAEGPFYTKREVVGRLLWMDKQIPRGFLKRKMVFARFSVAPRGGG